MNNKIKLIIQSLANHLGYQITKLNLSHPNFHPQGNNELEAAFYQQQTLIGDRKNIVIFDVGAFVGETTLIYKGLFPTCQIHCFEPFNESFVQLEKNLSEVTNTHLLNFGLSNLSGHSLFNSNKFSATNSLLASSDEGNETWSETWNTGVLETKESLILQMDTVDNYVLTNGIKRIDILKLDVQGAEYLVLKGAENTLKEGLIDIIYTEIIVMPTYVGQMEIENFIMLVKSYGYELYNLYNFNLTDNGKLRQCDAIFIRLGYAVSI